MALNILIVDDSLIVASRLSEILEKLGHNIVGQAKNGREAVDMYDQLRPHLVTMDITMPDMDGIEATKLIIRKNPKALIIMVTSHGQEQMVFNALKAGAKGYVLKPFSMEKIKNSISNLLKKFKC